MADEPCYKTWSRTQLAYGYKRLQEAMNTLEDQTIKDIIWHKAKIDEFGKFEVDAEAVYEIASGIDAGMDEIKLALDNLEKLENL